jgi:hypothetical protein
LRRSCVHGTENTYTVERYKAALDAAIESAAMPSGYQRAATPGQSRSADGPC